MYVYRPAPKLTKKPAKRKFWPVVAAVAVLLLAVGALAVIFRNDKKSDSQKVTASQADTQTASQTPEKPPLVDLQPVVDSWLAGQSAEFGIVVYDPANQAVVASHNPDKKFFAASLYKLFVAYLALEDFQSGTQNPDAVLWGGFTWKQCVDKMIRESHSPCGEAMMAAMGQQTLRERVNAMGIANTIFAGITTTAQDSALILERIVSGQDLTAENTAFLKDAMRIQDQKFRNGLAKGAPDAVWETKVGWNEQYNYHDVGIMTLPSGRQYVVAILSQNNGSSAPIADFSATMYQALQ